MSIERWLRPWVRLLRWTAGALMPLTASAALACSTMVLGLPERPIVAYSFDYAATGAGFIFVNPRGATRRSIMGGAPAEWTVRYGSVTFNQIGPGMPAAGMNTAGLVVSLMWNNEAVYDRRGNAPVLNELEFIQRLLDTSGSVDEALRRLKDIRIHGMVPIHFLLADRTGRTAVVTPTAARFQIHTGDDLPMPALTNTSYAELMENVSVFEGFGGEKAVPTGDSLEDPNSLERFAIAATASLRTGSPTTTDKAFEVLGDVANPETRWQIVFDPLQQQIAFRIVDREGTHRVNMPGIDFRCRDRPLFADLREVSHTDLLAALAPTDPAEVGGVAREVLASLPRSAGLGPDVAAGLVNGLLDSVTCAS